MKKRTTQSPQPHTTTSPESIFENHNTPAWYYYLIPPLVLALITTLVYLSSLHYDFQFDDVANITKHFNIRHNTFKSLFLSGSRWLIYWINSVHYSIGRFDPFSYRVGNLIIHITNGLFTFFITLLALAGLKEKSFFKRYTLAIATITSMLFLLHPVQTQTVSYVIQGELEGLAALTMLGMTLCFLIFCRTHSFVLKYLSVALLYFFGFFSCGTKEIAIISPFLILMVDWFFVAQGSLASLKKRAWLHGTIFMLIFGLYRAWFGHFAQILSLKKVAANNLGNIITHTPTAKITPWAFFISEFKVIVHYLWIFLWPFNISVEYDWMLVKGFFAPDCLFPFLGLVGLAALILKMLRRNPADIRVFGLLWFFVAIAPRATIVPSAELIVDYKTYTPSFGILFILACAIVALCGYLAETNKRFALFQQPAYTHLWLMMICALPLGFAAYKRNQVWSSGIAFWGNVIENAPGKARAYNNYGVELSLHLKKYKDAIPYFKKAISMDRLYPDPCNNLAVCYGHLDKIDDAIKALKQGLRINPYYPEGYNNLASFLIQKGEFASARTVLQTAIQLRPYYGKAYFNLARAYLAEKESEKAWTCLKKACTEADLDTDVGFATLGQLSIELKKYSEAIASYKKVLEINPNYPEGHLNLANAYHLDHHYKEAISVYQHILQREPNNIKALYNLAESYYLSGETQNALITFTGLKKYRNAMPHLSTRIASCFEKLGNRAQAQQELQFCLNSKNTPDTVKQMAQNMLDKMAQPQATVIT